MIALPQTHNPPAQQPIQTHHVFALLHELVVRNGARLFAHRLARAKTSRDDRGQHVIARFSFSLPGLRLQLEVDRISAEPTLLKVGGLPLGNQSLKRVLKARRGDVHS
jgi:hypothetical protein